MAKATGKDHAEINLAIWGDDDWLDLSPRAQHLYFVLWTSPQLSYCGAGEWHAGRIAAMAQGWTAESVEAAAAELSRHLFLIIDTDTEEFLLRSWIKHDALWKKPNMAVSMANARAALASRKLRGVVVHEVTKIKARNIADAKTDSEVVESAGWQRDAVKELLSQKAVDPAELEPFTPRPTPPLTPNPTPGLTVSGGDGVNPPSNPGPTPTPAPFSYSNLQGGNVSTEGHQGTTPDPRPECHDHQTNHDGPCRACKRRRDWDERHEGEALRSELEEKRRLREIAVNCPRCQGTNTYTVADGFAAKCNHELEAGEAESA